MNSFGKLKIHKNKPTIIAEVGVNHECNLKKAFKLISDAKNCGVDAVKFQTYKADELAIKNSPAYWDTEKEKTPTQRLLFEKYDKFEDKEFKSLSLNCRKKKIIFMSTLFSVDLVNRLHKFLPLLKVASADITNVPLLRAISKTKKPVLLSTGASTEDEIKYALKILNLPIKQVCIMHCVLNYPTKDENANLNFISTLKKKFPKHLIGYSDHVSPDKQLTSVETAWNLGAQIIEKHFTFDKKRKGNDHYHSADKQDFINFFKRIKKINQLRGKYSKNLRNEQNSIKYARRSIIANKDIKKGEKFSEFNLTTKRPGIYITANKWDKLLNKTSKRNIKADTPIRIKDF